MKKIILTIVVLIFAQNTFAGDQQIDCSAERRDGSKVDVRIRASFFSEEGSAPLRDGRIRFGKGREFPFGQSLIIRSKIDGTLYYEARTIEQNGIHFRANIFHGGKFKLYEKVVTYPAALIFEGYCHLNTTGPI